jgi:hypothetical protein
MRLALPACAVALLFAAAAGPARAQVDESLVTRHWKTTNFYAETFDKPIVTDKGKLDDGDDDIRIFHWNSEGRIKFSRKQLEPPVWLGYRALTISISSDDERLDHAFGDVALAVAVRLGEIGDWEVIAAAGGGTANDGRWDNRHALYAAATLDFLHKWSNETIWHVGISLDGNRSLLQGWPLPYAAFESAPDPSINVLLGFPRSEVVYRPFEPLALTLRWVFPSTAQARVEMDLGAGVSVFLDAGRRIDGFHLRHHEHTRLFYEMNTAEAGIRWKSPWIDVSLSAGIAFGQRFFTGFDINHRTPGSTVEDLAFIAITLPSKFWAIPF